MSFSKIYFVISFLFLFSCSQIENKEKLKINDLINTILIGNKDYSIKEIGKLEYNKYPLKENFYEKETTALSKDSLVSRNQDSLIFQLKTGEKLIFKNDSTDENWSIYKFQGDLSDLDYWIVHVTHYEWWNNLLIDKLDGDTTITIGRPFVSYDKKHILCSNVDLTANYTDNGFELYEVNNKDLNLIQSKILENFGIEELKWKDSNTILAKQIVLDSSLNESIKYVKFESESSTPNMR